MTIGPDSQRWLPGLIMRAQSGRQSDGQEPSSPDPVRRAGAIRRILPEPCTRRLSDHQYRTTGRENGSSGVA
jgi:hypothetical protein